MNITIEFTSPKKTKPVSWLIKKYMCKNYSHVCYKFSIKEIDRDIKYEAIGSGIRFIGVLEWEKSAVVINQYNLDVSEQVYKKMFQHCIDNSGVDYGFLQNVGIVIADLFDLDHNPFPNHRNCSEELARILEIDGFKFNKNRNLLTPADIEASIIEKIGENKN